MLLGSGDEIWKLQAYEFVVVVILKQSFLLSTSLLGKILEEWGRQKLLVFFLLLNPHLKQARLIVIINS